MTALRLYQADECGADGYPLAWHSEIKHEVRRAAGSRCVRCGHPYKRGAGEWSRCDEGCRHGGPLRLRTPDGYAIYESRDPPEGASFPREARWRILTVHHLDGDKRNCRWWNLAALCQRCHLTIQGKVRMAQVWPHPHTRWFRPYAAGYYAWCYLQEDLDRPEVEERLDELLALEGVA